MKTIAITLCLSLLATLASGCKAQALSMHERFMKVSYTKMTKFRPLQQIASTTKPVTKAVPEPEATTVAESTPSQPAPRDPRRAPKEPCPACGMG
jgi:hypothetical protein